MNALKLRISDGCVATCVISFAEQTEEFLQFRGTPVTVPKLPDLGELKGLVLPPALLEKTSVLLRLD